jgi:hypothetical protein
MAITIDQDSMVFLPTLEPNIMEVRLEYTKDDVQSSAGIKDWQATWKQVMFLWNKNAPAVNFLGAVQDAIATVREEKAAQTTVKQALITATGQCRKVSRTDPNAKSLPIPGTSADNPLFVKVVT